MEKVENLTFSRRAGKKKETCQKVVAQEKRKKRKKFNIRKNVKLGDKSINNILTFPAGNSLRSLSASNVNKDYFLSIREYKMKSF